jgi:hypothetical protein
MAGRRRNSDGRLTLKVCIPFAGDIDVTQAGRRSSRESHEWATSSPLSRTLEIPLSSSRRKNAEGVCGEAS